MSSFHSTRRDFIAVSSLALAGVGLNRSHVNQIIPIKSRQPISTFIPEIVDADRLHTLGQVAVDSAKQAGASYADIRIASARQLLTQWASGPSMGLQVESSYGVRTFVDGIWAFAYGVDLTPDAVTRTVHSAITTARGLKRYVLSRPSMTARPAVRGEWSALPSIDPYEVSPDEHGKMVSAYAAAARRVLDAESSRTQFVFTAETRVFASTEGTLITQRLGGFEPWVEVEGLSVGNGGSARLRVRGLSPGRMGFEAVCGAELQERVKETAEEARLLASYPVVEAEVGRYPAVFDGFSAGAILNNTLVPALEMDRVLGYEADSVGGSFLSPTRDVLGQPLFSPHLTLTAGRTAPLYGAVKWDDEGVESETFPVIQKGAVVDYFATRASAAASESTIRPRGTAVSYTPSKVPFGRGTHVTMSADQNGQSMSEMIKSLSKGLLVMNSSAVSTNQQLAGGLLRPNMIFEVKDGKISRRLRWAAVQFSSKVLWKNLAAVGNQTTMQDAFNAKVEGEVMRAVVCRTPAVQFKAVDLINIGPRLS